MAAGTQVFWLFAQGKAGIELPGLASRAPNDPLPAAVAGAQALAKASAYATAMVFLFMCLGCILVCHLVIARQLPARRFRAEAAVWALIAAVVGFVFFGSPPMQVYHYFGEHLFEQTVFTQAGSIGGWNAFSVMFQGATAAAAIAGTYVVGAICITLGATAQSSPANFMAARPDLKYLLFAASSVFVLGVVCAHAFNGWAASFYLPSESVARKQFSLALQAFISVQATVYFLILAAMFAPVAYVALRRRSSLWATGHAGTAVWSDVVQHLVAVAAPLITAPLLALIGAPAAA